MIRFAHNFAARRLAVVCLAAVLLYSCQGQQPADPPSGIEGTGLTSGTAPPTMKTASGPTIASLSPDCAPRGEQILNPNTSGHLYLLGSNFLANSVVRWNGSDLPTTFVSSTQLTAQVPATAIAAVGTAAVTVLNPGPGEGGSNTATFTITAGSVSPNSIAVDPAGHFAYVANEGCGASTFGYVSMYTIDATTGSLTSVGPPVLTNDEGADSVAVSPDGRFVYVANWGEGDTSGSISVYSTNVTTGALTFTSRAWAPCVGSPGSCAPWSVAVHPSSNFVYVANEGGFAPTSVSMYSVHPKSGVLGLIGLVVVGSRASSVAMHPSGKFAYVGEFQEIGGSNDDLSMYAIDPTTGALTSIGTVAAGVGPSTSIVIDPFGKFAYVTNSGSNDVSTYIVNSTTGALTSTGTIAAGSGPTSIAIHPSGKFAYVTNSGSNDVWEYGIDVVTGALTLIGSIGT